jgi:uncharacterized protein (TIGR02996 family)
MHHTDSSPSMPQSHELLLRMLASWSQCKDPNLGHAIVRVGGNVATRRQAISATSKAETEDKWLAIAAERDPGDVERLIGTPWPARWKVALKRIAAFAAFPRDPRIARALPDIAARYPTVGAQPLHAVIGTVLAVIADPAGLEDIERIRRTRRQRGAYRAALANIEATKPSAAPPDLLAEAALVGSGAEALDTLWESCWDNPADMNSRLILADALLQTGDPRGEFILLQHRVANGTGDSKTERRIRELLKAHIDAWTGPLPLIRASRRFECGFLAEATVHMDKDIGSNIDAKEWRTLKRLTAPTYSVPLSAIAERMPCLEVLNTRSLNPRKMTELLSGRPFPSIRVLGTTDDWQASGPMTALPNLHTLICLLPLLFQRSVEDLKPEAESLLQSAEAAGVPRLLLTGARTEHLGPWLQALAARPRTPTVCLTLGGWGMKDPFGGAAWRLQLRAHKAELGWCARAGNFDPAAGIDLIRRVESAGYPEVVVHTPARSKSAKEGLAVMQKELSERVSFSQTAFDPLGWRPQ